MRPHLAMLSARFRALLQYRAAALAGFFTQMFWGLIRMMIFAAFYASTTAPQPMTLEQVTAYVWLSQAFLLLLPFRADPQIAETIRSGNVASELVRPVGLYGIWLSRAVANRTAPVLLRCLPQLAIATAFGWIRWDNPAGIAACALSLVGALAISATLSVLFDITVFWTLSGQGINSILSAAMFVLSGMIVPLPLFPAWLQDVLAWLPFRGLIDIPFRLFTGDLPALHVWPLLAQQLAWALALAGLGRLVLAAGLRRVVVQGG